MAGCLLRACRRRNLRPPVIPCWFPRCSRSAPAAPRGPSALRCVPRPGPHPPPARERPGDAWTAQSSPQLAEPPPEKLVCSWHLARRPWLPATACRSPVPQHPRRPGWRGRSKGGDTRLLEKTVAATSCPLHRLRPDFAQCAAPLCRAFRADGSLRPSRPLEARTTTSGTPRSRQRVPDQRHRETTLRADRSSLHLHQRLTRLTRRWIGTVDPLFFGHPGVVESARQSLTVPFN